MADQPDTPAPRADESRALRIARWMEPDKPWHIVGDDVGLVHWLEHARWKEGEPARPDPWGSFQDDSRDDIAAAERVAIERGLRKVYGRLLLAEVRGADDAIEGYSGFSELATVATAPLSARVRALVRLIEETEKSST
jgi:hypothetical protein